ncbi:MAG TPA: helix-turn-helix domain-containing protein [Solirubrobacterales bacterium]|jgi:DNA-binding HxlR family transcriptional regulator
MVTKVDMRCAIARSLSVLGERWTFLILREANFGKTKFGEFREALGIAPDVLTERLATLVDNGVMERVPYREPGARAREAYVLTEAGRELEVILSALQQWGDEYLPRPEGPTVLRRLGDTGRPVHVAYVDEQGHEVDRDAVAIVKTAAFPT